MLPFSRKKNIDLNLNIELSTNKHTPNILRIFGDHVSPGSNYKACRVTTISTAQEVVRVALEKFNLERFDPQDFVLCDVIGRFSMPNSSEPAVPAAATNEKSKKKSKSRKGSDRNDDPMEEKPVWVTEYVRPISEVEKPLILQSLWKPTNGKARRFELRNRMELNSFFFINHSDSGGGDSRSPSGTSLVNGSINSTDAHSTYSDPPKHRPPHTASSENNSSSSISHHMSVKNPGRLSEIGQNVAPAHDPHLLMLKGCSTQDKLVHRLQDPTVIVGAYLEHDKKHCDVMLYSSDVVLPHCWLYKKVKKLDNPDETSLDELKYLIYLEPANGADILVNGKFVSNTTLLKPGDLLSFGAHYVFMFKDPGCVKDANITLPWFTQIKNAQLPPLEDGSADVTKYDKEPEYATVTKVKETRDKCIQVELTELVSMQHAISVENGDDSDLLSSDNDEEKRHSDEPSKSIEKSMLQLAYRLKDEDDLLHSIIDIADGDIGSFKLLPAYFFVMAIEHSARNFADIQTRKLLLKISSGLQGIAWEKTKEIGKTTGAAGVKNEDTMVLHNRLLPELKPVLFWLTNALQMLHFLQCNLKQYLLPREQLKSIQNAVLTADEELLSVLEEVIMFTFQQIVYHLTKVLYGALPAVLEVNPFQAAGDDDDDDDDGDTKPAHPLITQITHILNDVLMASQENQIHPQIISQIFAYLFFFCNALLFNSLLEKGPTTKIFRWAKGVQIRGNIDVLEEWAQVNGLGKEFEEFLGKFTSAVALLSTPKVQLMQYEWAQLRNDYSALNPAQLQLILGEYQLNGKQKPRGWYPIPDEVEAALQTSEVLESFATHPPLMLPSSNFILDLNTAPECDEFFKLLNGLNAKYDRDIEVVAEEPIQPKVRSDHHAKIPILEIKPVPPPPANGDEAAAAPTTSTSPREVVNENYEVAIDSFVTLSTPQQEVVTVDVHHSESSASHGSQMTAPLLTDDDDDSSQYVDMTSQELPEDKTPRQQKPPRGSVDFDPKFDNEEEQQQKQRPKSKVAPFQNDANTLNIDINIDTKHNGSSNGVNDHNGDTNGHSNGHHYENNDNNYDSDDDEVYYVELKRENNVLGLGLIDGQFTPLKNNGVYIRTIVPNTPAACEDRLRIGDRILSVNGENVLDKDYSYAMGLIKASGDQINLVISISSEETVSQILEVA